MDETERGTVGAILGREVTPIMQELVGRMGVDLSPADQLAVVTAPQKAHGRNGGGA